MATTTLATTRGTTLTPGLDGWFAVILSPDCGTVAGRTCFLVFYRVAGGIDMAEFESCCRLHEPSGFVILIDEAEVIQIDVTDGYERSITTETDVTTIRNPEPGHYINPEQPWAWTLINGLPETVTHTDPDERGLFEVRPRPAEVPTDSGAPDTERQAPARGARRQGALLARRIPDVAAQAGLGSGISRIPRTSLPSRRPWLRSSWKTRTARRSSARTALRPGLRKTARTCPSTSLPSSRLSAEEDSQAWPRFSPTTRAAQSRFGHRVLPGPRNWLVLRA